MTSWWRSWHGAPTDAKWLLIASRANCAPGVVSAVFWALCDYASQQSERGSVEGFDTETYAAFSGFDLEQIDSVIAALREKQIIDSGKLRAWEKRQPKREDDSSDRVTRHRETKRTVTQCNAPERTEQIEQRERADARALWLCKEVAKTYEAAGYLPPDTSRCFVWLRQGYDERIIAPIVAERIKPGKGEKPLLYFEKIIAEAHAVKGTVKAEEPKPELVERTYLSLLDEEARTGMWKSTRVAKSDIPPAIIEKWQSTRTPSPEPRQ